MPAAVYIDKEVWRPGRNATNEPQNPDMLSSISKEISRDLSSVFYDTDRWSLTSTLINRILYNISLWFKTTVCGIHSLRVYRIHWYTYSRDCLNVTTNKGLTKTNNRYVKTIIKTVSWLSYRKLASFFTDSSKKPCDTIKWVPGRAENLVAAEKYNTGWERDLSPQGKWLCIEVWYTDAGRERQMSHIVDAAVVTCEL